MKLIVFLSIVILYFIYYKLLPNCEKGWPNISGFDGICIILGPIQGFFGFFIILPLALPVAIPILLLNQFGFSFPDTEINIIWFIWAVLLLYLFSCIVELLLPMFRKQNKKH